MTKSPAPPEAKAAGVVGTLRLAGILLPFVIAAMQRLGAPLGWQLAVTGAAAAVNLEYARRPVLLAQLALIALLGALLVGLKAENLPRIYPFLMSATGFMAFLASWRGDGEILAAHAGKFVGLSAARRAFLRSMVPVWTAGLFVNTAVLLVLVFFFSVEYWAWYSGFVSYLLLAALFGWTVFRRIAHKEASA